MKVDTAPLTSPTMITTNSNDPNKSLRNDAVEKDNNTIKKDKHVATAETKTTAELRFVHTAHI